MSLLKKVLQNHYKNYLNQSVENIKKDAKGLLHVISDYEGRVVFELLQNAFDKSEKEIGIYIHEDTLYVANDGTPFSYNQDYDYYKGENEKRGDFLSICSMFTSSKSVAIAIGNKGIGFKSVFSVAKNHIADNTFPSRFVDIYTKGEFFNQPGGDTINETCAFRIYEMIRDASVIKDLETNQISTLQSTIDAARAEYKDVGLPGYYFPFEIPYENDCFVNKLLQKHVTVIAIPLEKPDDIRELIKKNIVESGIQFNFIQLKYFKAFQIEVDFGNEEKVYSNVTTLNPSNLVSVTLKDHPQITQFAKAANINIQDVTIGLNFRADDKGKFYNYLPTDVPSPFPFIDFHADFRTMLNRTQINWDGAVGDYNKALLRACIELLFSLWDNQKANQKYEYILDVKKGLKFNTNYLHTKFDFRDKNRNIIEDIFQVNTRKYSSLCHWLAYNFNNTIEDLQLDSSKFQKSYEIIFSFINSVCDDYYAKASNLQVFYNAFKMELDQLEVEYLPRVKSNARQEVFYSSEALSINPLIAIAFTDVNIENKELKKALQVKNFEVLDEVIKHFKQTTFSGNYLDQTLSEVQQIELLKSLYNFYQRKDKKPDLSSHRYTTAINSELREKYSVTNHANFSVSTLFLKLKNGRYKPSQLCNFDELDEDFINSISAPKDFFVFLGVSMHPNSLFADLRIFNALEDGLDFLPQLFGYDNTDQINELLIQNLRVLQLKKRLVVHPALLNDNHPNLFFKMSVNDIHLRNELANLLVKKYNDFDKTYTQILIDYLNNNIAKEKELTTVYPSFFRLLAKNNHYIIFTGEKLEITNNLNFIIFQNKEDLNEAIRMKISGVLIYEAERGLFDIENLKKKTLEYTVKENVNETNINNQLKSRIREKLPFLLYKITMLKSSEYDFIENSDYDILQSFEKLVILDVEKLNVEKDFGNFKLSYDKNYHILNQKIFLKDKSEYVIAKALSKYFFHTESYATEVELVLFHTTIEHLNKQVNIEEFNIIRSNYDLNFIEKRKKFLQLLQEKFNEIDISDDQWFRYNSNYESTSIQNLIDGGHFQKFRDYLLELKYSEDFKDVNINVDLDVNLGREMTVETFANKEVEEIDFLIHKISSLSKKTVEAVTYEHSDVTTFKAEKNTNKIKCFNHTNANSVDLESIGTNGEHDVLQYYVEQFRSLSIEDKLQVTDSTLALIERHIHDSSYYKNLKEELDSAIINSCDYLKYLVPYLYTTAKYKFSYFDLIGFKNNEAQLVEVKTTSSTYNNYFYFSKAEINCALSGENYEIVRCSPNLINFLGNPLTDFKQGLEGIKNKYFIIEATNFRINYIP